MKLICFSILFHNHFYLFVSNEILEFIDKIHLEQLFCSETQLEKFYRFKELEEQKDDENGEGLSKEELAEFKKLKTPVSQI